MPARVTDAAVEAAARAEYEHAEQDSWDDAHRDDRADYLETARVGLEAAAPHMTAEGN